MFEDTGCHLKIDQWNDTYGKSIQIFYLYQIPNKNWQKEEISSLSIWSADHLMWIKKKNRIMKSQVSVFKVYVCIFVAQKGQSTIPGMASEKALYVILSPQEKWITLQWYSNN